QHLLRAHRLQAKLTVSQPDDIYEQEAERVADEVMRMPAPDAAGEEIDARCGAPKFQRACAGCEEEMQRQAPAAEADGPPAQSKRGSGTLHERAGAIEPYIQTLAGRGQPLPDSARDYMEARFGADFGHVRLHSDAEADRSARAIDALAFT